MREYVAARQKAGGKPPKRTAPIKGREAATVKPVDPVPSVQKARELTKEQATEVYESAKSKILLAHGGTVERLTRNCRDGLPVERARERLLAQGITNQVVDAFNEIVKEKGLVFSEPEKDAIKLFLLNPERLGMFIDGMIENMESK